MAKNKVEIDVSVNDKGSTKKVGLNAKKASNELGNLSRGAGQADRNIKGAAQASSGASKNFSKMSQGMGGLVGVYATLAAQAFALSAAYEFLKRVGDLKVLKDSQIAYASSTGIAITSLTNDIRLAAEGMLTFEDASKAAAIGLSSGLSSGQLSKLAAGAASVSKVLGRDVTDSFDRLVRGVTKAEPELLDELGIILRLDNAKQKYAISIGKTVKQLSLLEQKQAVLVDVQTQLDQKFSGVTKAIDIQGNAVKKFGVAFNDVFIKFAEYIGPSVTAIATFFTQNIKSLIAVIALFALTLVKSMLPSLDSFGERATANALKAEEAFQKAKVSFDSMKKAAAGADTAKAAVSGIQGAKPGSGIYALQNDEFVNKRKAAMLLKYAEQEKGVYTQLTKYQQVVYKKALRNILGMHQTTWQKLNYGWRATGAVIQRVATTVEYRWKQAMAGIAAAAAWAGKKINLAFKITGIIGIVIMLFDLAKMAAEALGLIKPPSDSVLAFTKKLEDNKESLKSLSEEYSLLADAMQKHIDAANKGRETILPTADSYIKLGNAVSTSARELADYIELSAIAAAGQADAKTHIDKDKWALVLGADFDDILKDSTKSAQALNLILMQTMKIPAFKSIVDSSPAVMKAFKAISKGAINTADVSLIRDFADQMELLSQVTSTFKESFSNSELAFQSFILNITGYKTSATDLLKSTLDEIDSLASNFKGLGQALLGTTTFEEEKKSLIERLAFLSLIDRKETKQQLAQVSADRKHAIALHGMTSLVRERLEGEKKSIDLNIKYNGKVAELAIMEEKGIARNSEKYQLLLDQTAALKDQMALQSDLNNGLYKLGMAGAEAFETGFQSNLKDLITGQETSLKRAMGNLLLGVGDALANELSNQLTEKLMSKILPKKKKPDELMKESISTATKDAAELWRLTFMKASLDFAQKIEEARVAPPLVKDPLLDTSRQRPTLETVTGNLDPNNKYLPDGTTVDKAWWVRMAPYGVGPLANGMGVKVPGSAAESGPKLAPVITWDAPAGGKGVTSSKPAREVINGQETLTGATEAAIVATDAATDTSEKLFAQGGTFDTVFGLNVDKMVSGMGGVMAGLIGGAAGGSGGLLSMVIGAAFTGVMGGIGSLSNSMRTTASTIAPMGATDFYSGYNTGGTLVGRTGGMFTNGRKIPGYATGGVAQGSQGGYPVTLHGTEAVVPLPNGNSIPVEMKNGAGQNNNVVVNVSMDSKGNSTSTTESQNGLDAGKMGGAIARAVQEELQNQKRSGGILNPYGVA